MSWPIALIIVSAIICTTVIVLALLLWLYKTEPADPEKKHHG